MLQFLPPEAYIPPHSTPSSTLGLLDAASHRLVAIALWVARPILLPKPALARLISNLAKFHHPDRVLTLPYLADVNSVPSVVEEIIDLPTPTIDPSTVISPALGSHAIPKYALLFPYWNLDSFTLYLSLLLLICPLIAFGVLAYLDSDRESHLTEVPKRERPRAATRPTPRYHGQPPSSNTAHVRPFEPQTTEFPPAYVDRYTAMVKVTFDRSFIEGMDRPFAQEIVSYTVISYQFKEKRYYKAHPGHPSHPDNPAYVASQFQPRFTEIVEEANPVQPVNEPTNPIDAADLFSAPPVQRTPLGDGISLESPQGDDGGVGSINRNGQKSNKGRKKKKSVSLPHP